MSKSTLPADLIPLLGFALCRSLPRRPLCSICQHPILTGEGTRQVAGKGKCHARCAPISSQTK